MFCYTLGRSPFNELRSEAKATRNCSFIRAYRQGFQTVELKFFIIYFLILDIPYRDAVSNNSKKILLISYERGK